MPGASRAPRVLAEAERILAGVGILKNPYLEALGYGSMTLEEFRRTQEQFYHAVTFFSRPMAALVARIPDPKARLDILHNLIEEHGDFQEHAFHQNTFRRFIGLIQGKARDLEQAPLWPELRAFNSVLVSACLMDELEVGVGCMGIIEYAFADISARIGTAVVKNGWVRKEDLIHYSLHAQIDVRHSEEFFAVVESRWDDPSRRYFVEQGLELGAYVFDRLYRDLYRKGKEGV